MLIVVVSSCLAVRAEWFASIESARIVPKPCVTQPVKLGHWLTTVQLHGVDARGTSRRKHIIDGLASKNAGREDALGNIAEEVAHGRSIHSSSRTRGEDCDVAARRVRILGQ